MGDEKRTFLDLCDLLEFACDTNQSKKISSTLNYLIHFKRDLASSRLHGLEVDGLMFDFCADNFVILLYFLKCQINSNLFNTHLNPDVVYKLFLSLTLS